MEKQRAILLTESDFDFKQTWGDGLVPLEHHGLRDQNCLELVLTKTFFNNMMRQRCSTEAEG